MIPRYYVVMSLVTWKALNVEFANQGSLGYLPVYDSVEALRKDYPTEPFIVVKKDPRAKVNFVPSEQ